MMYDSLTQSPPPFLYFLNRLKIFNTNSLVFGFNFFQALFLLLPADVICSQERI